MTFDTVNDRRRALRAGFKSSPLMFYPISGTTIDSDYRAHIAAYYYTNEEIIPPDNSFAFTGDFGSTIYVHHPLWGYETIVNLPLFFQERANGTVGIFDPGSDYDNRICRCVLLSSPDEQDDLITFFRDSELGRGSNILLTLNTDSGFFPFGPDYGDSGVFTVQITDFSPSEQLMSPLRWWKNEIVMQYISGPTPAYSLPSVVEYGNLQIGTITNFRYPQSTFRTKYNYAITNTTLYGGIDQVDLGSNSDRWDVEFTITCTQSAAANLIDYLVSIPRDTVNKTYSTFPIITADNNFIFGYENAASASYNVQLIDNDISITHVNYDIYEIKLKVKKT